MLVGAATFLLQIPLVAAGLAWCFCVANAVSNVMWLYGLADVHLGLVWRDGRPLFEDLPGGILRLRRPSARSTRPDGVFRPFGVCR
jgi:hypothetical protein